MLQTKYQWFEEESQELERRRVDLIEMRQQHIKQLQEAIKREKGPDIQTLIKLLRKANDEKDI